MSALGSLLATSLSRSFHLLPTAFLVFSCCEARSQSADISDSRVNVIPKPIGLMWPTFPTAKAPTKSEVELGRELFFDSEFSADRSVSCASCHNPKTGFSDGKVTSVGVHGKRGERNSPTLLNAAFFDSLSWDGRHNSLEDQTLGALMNQNEMALDIQTTRRLLKSKYERPCTNIYGETTEQSFAKAVAAYQRSLLAGNSPFDRYLYLHEENAISTQAKSGFKLFLTRARCVQCHFIRSELSHPFGGTTALFTDNRFHNIGIGVEKSGVIKDLGRGRITGKKSDQGSFKTPTLRNVTLTAPYMHDGSLSTLEEVVEHYNKGGNPNAFLDVDIQPLGLGAEEKASLIEFMKSLTSPEWDPKRFQHPGTD